MKHRLTQLLGPARTAIDRVLAQPLNGKPIPREYQGYISSFGASVKQMGLLPTLAAFAGTKADGGSNEDRPDLLTVLHEVVTHENSGLNSQIKAKLKSKKYWSTRNEVEHEDLFLYALEIVGNDADLHHFQLHLLEAVVATKLAIRTFELSK